MCYGSSSHNKAVAIYMVQANVLTCTFFLQIALALQHCHLLNIAHRDLKPENLLFKDNSLEAPVKLCDFGFAKIDQGDLMTPQFTPYYVAPQVLEAQRRHQKEKSGIIPTSPTPYTYNKSCDLWSLGVIIYVMLCGYPPFYSKHHSRTIPKDMRKKIMTGSFEFPEEEWSQISEMAKDIVRKLLKVKPEERLTIEGVLDHPWLNSTEALDNILPSAQMMMDKVVIEFFFVPVTKCTVCVNVLCILELVQPKFRFYFRVGRI
ncbi:hypothetical protein GDO81_002393 [Engystomops pustulosus]|uniref:Protein kinase domain-containing protein n=1 Tax=Engystomops pustulosus TaxID=76066 RepID=A0AAV7DKV2_ENGPU|nr:hypothetical protein GDO81_002393 [Engystomops pustulosus]